MATSGLSPHSHCILIAALGGGQSREYLKDGEVPSEGELKGPERPEDGHSLWDTVFKC